MVQEGANEEALWQFSNLLFFFIFRTYVAALLFSLKYGSEFLIHMFKTFNKFSKAYLIQ